VRSMLDDRAGATITAADIPWELSPPPTLSSYFPVNQLTGAADDLLVDALLAADSYRQVARAFLHGLHALHVEHQRVRQDRDRLRAENRTLRRPRNA
jgi:hypothetical protein